MVVDAELTTGADIWHWHHQVLRQTQAYGLAQLVGPEYPIPPHWPHSGTGTPVPGAVVVGVDVGVGGDDGLEVVVVNVVPVVVVAVLVLAVLEVTVLVVAVLAVLVVVVLVGEGSPPEPRYWTTSSWNPGFLYSWLMSHIITPPKLAKPWL